MQELLSPLVIASLIIAGSAAFGVSMVMRFVPRRDELSRKLRATEQAIERLRVEIVARQDRVRELQAEVEQLQTVYARLEAYCGKLRTLEIEAERRGMKQAQAEEEEQERDRRRKRVQRVHLA